MNTNLLLFKKSVALFALVFMIFTANISQAQTYLMSPVGSDVTCLGNFYDSGDVGAPYGLNENSTHTFCPSTVGAMLQVDFTAFDLEINFDFLTIYDGPTIGSPLIGTFNGTVSPGTVTSTDPSGCLTFVFTSGGPSAASPLIGTYTGTANPGTITSTDVSGCLTFVFTSDGSIANAGWEAILSCTPPVIYVEPTVPSLTSSAVSVCAGGLVTLTIQGNLNDATDWMIYAGSCGGTLVGSTTTATFDVFPLVPTVYYVRGEGGCSTPGSCQLITINVTADITVPVPLVTTLLPLSGVCSATPNPPSALDNCAGTILGASSHSFPITTVGTTVITWTYDDGNGNSTTQLHDIVVLGPDATVTQNGSTLTANNSTATYQWLDCDNGNTVIPGATNQSYTTAVPGSFAVIVTDVCMDTSACYGAGYTGVDDLTSSFEISVAPNPSSGLFAVSMNGLSNEKVEVKIFDMVGKIIYKSTVTPQEDAFEMLVDLSNNETGVYILNVISESGAVYSNRMVKQ